MRQPICHYGVGRKHFSRIGSEARSLDSTGSRGAVVPQAPIAALLIAAFGPYLLGGIRTEQAVVYLSAVFFAVVMHRRIAVPRSARWLVAAWIGYLAVAFVGTLSSFVSGPPPYPRGSFVAGLDNILLPLAAASIVWMTVPLHSAKAMLTRASRIVSVAMSINGLVAVISLKVDLSMFLRPFWAPEDDILTVAEKAASMGRLCGILNQPAEAGVLYSLAGIATVFGWRNREALVSALLVLSTLGGLLSVSKIFVLLGLPVTLAYWLLSASKGRRLLRLLMAAALGLVTVVVGPLNGWSGLDYLMRLFRPTDQSLVGLYSAGRFGPGSDVAGQGIDAFFYNPIVGSGVAGWAVPADGMVFESLIVAGMLGLFCQVFVLLLLLRLFGHIDLEVRGFALCVGLVVLAGSLGFSPLTANRAATVLWIFIALLTQLVDYGKMASIRIVAEISPAGPTNQQSDLVGTASQPLNGAR